MHTRARVKSGEVGEARGPRLSHGPAGHWCIVISLPRKVAGLLRSMQREKALLSKKRPGAPVSSTKGNSITSKK